MLVDDLNSRAGKIVSEWDGIYPVYEAFYIESIKYSVKRALDAFDRYGEALEQGHPDTAVSSIHEALSHSAGLSRFFWPSSIGGKSKKNLVQLRETRAAKLRNAFGLDEKSPLKDRRLRDALEHFDERLDEYLLTDPVGNIMPGPIIARLHPDDEPIAHIFKMVDPEQAVFVLLGKTFEFKPIYIELARVQRFADDMSLKGHRLNFRDT